MKCIPCLFLFIFFLCKLPAQNIDSLKTALSLAKEDTGKVNLYIQISAYYNYKYPDTVLLYALKGLALSRKLNFKTGEIAALTYEGEALNTKAQYPKALEVKLIALREAEQLGNTYLVASCYNFLGALYLKSEDYTSALVNYNHTKINSAYYLDHQKFILCMIGRCHFFLNNIDSATHYIAQAYQLDLQDNTHWTVPYYTMAAIQEKKGNMAEALRFYKAGNQLPNIGPLDILNGYNGMAAVYKKIGAIDSAKLYAKKVVKEGTTRSLLFAVMDASKLLTSLYKSAGETDSAFKYQEIMLAAKDSIFSRDNIRMIQTLTFNEQKRQGEIEQARRLAEQEYKTKVKLYSLLAGIIVLILVASILYSSNQHKQKAKLKIEKAYAELSTAQAQLIQSEKMASLGELTAGIAHEIQNPLNFVNNFSDVNKELLQELSDEIANGNYDDAGAIAKDVIANEEKINHHGKRADNIVKSMLQHSRHSEGKKEPTDINKLADEYVRLAYNGLKAKDATFNATINIAFDDSIPLLNIVPQEMGRVLLNLLNNAFYAVNERLRQAQPGKHYQPMVSVETKKHNNSIEIAVRDNGNGIPQEIKDKIFQPFFTTKPTGTGTGLGLSLAYDIVKAHGGEIKVVSKPGEGTDFIIQLFV